ncbi:MAG: hypothetical protein K0U93_30290 [Gammaproteobacteria bacterium]|nr:hypothetical protein [Gammaproteobacteria bacterium]
MTTAKWLNTAYSHPDEIPAERWSKLMMSREQYASMVRERAARDAHAPKVGEPAPAFSAHRLSADGALTGEMFTLSTSLGRPIGLIFGSYT